LSRTASKKTSVDPDPRQERGITLGQQGGQLLHECRKNNLAYRENPSVA